LGHRKAAYVILTELYTPETIKETETRRRTFRWYLRIDHLGLEAGQGLLLGRDWFCVDDDYDRQQLSQDSQNTDLRIQSAIARDRLTAVDMAVPAKDKEAAASAKRRCVSTACIACRRRKSKVCLPPGSSEPSPVLKSMLTFNVMFQCDGNTPSCATCASVYGTKCVYDPKSDRRRKGVYKKEIDNLRSRDSTLQTLMQAMLNQPENKVSDLVRQIRTCESLDDFAESILSQRHWAGRSQRR